MLTAKNIVVCPEILFLSVHKPETVRRSLHAELILMGHEEEEEVALVLMGGVPTLVIGNSVAGVSEKLLEAIGYPSHATENR